MDKNLNIGLVISQFNQPIMKLMKAQAIEAFKDLFTDQHQMVIQEVPGAVELPYMQQELIVNKAVDGVVVLGCVIKGETDHYEYVCQMVSQGCMEVTLKHHVPMGFGLITAQNYELAKARCANEKSKAKEAVKALYDVMLLGDKYYVK